MYYLVLDIGTTGIKVFVFDKQLQLICKEYKKLEKNFPQEGWVEQNPYQYLKISEQLLKKAVKSAKIDVKKILGLGITNQRETTIVWDQEMGRTIYDAIVWEDIRTLTFCHELKSKWEQKIRKKTGLSIDPYFSATKLHWILDNVPNAISLLDEGRLIFGTVDSWIIWNLTKEKIHVTDTTNASRTMLFDIKKKQWDAELLNLFEIPGSMLPHVVPSICESGHLQKDILGVEIPVVAISGDQQSSMYAAGMKKGTTKVTYGTGTFISQVIGKTFTLKDKFFTTLTPSHSYMYEAKIACCGKQAEPILKKPKELHPLLENLATDVASYINLLEIKPKEILVDGGLSQSEYLLTYQEELLEIPLKKQTIFDGTALGCAMLVQEASQK